MKPRKSRRKSDVAWGADADPVPTLEQRVQEMIEAARIDDEIEDRRIAEEMRIARGHTFDCDCLQCKPREEY